MEWNKPSRTDWYIMQETAEIRRSWIKNKSQPDAKKFKIPFVFETKDGDGEDSRYSQMTPDEASKSMIDRFVPLFGGKPIMTHDPDGNLIEWDGSLYPNRRPSENGDSYE